MDPGTILAVASIVIQGIDVALSGCRRLYEHKKGFQELPDQLKDCKARVITLQHHIKSIQQSKRNLSQVLLSIIEGIDDDFRKMKEILAKWENSDKCSKKDALKFLKDAPRDAKSAKAISKSLDRRTIDLLLGLSTGNSVCGVEELDSFLPIARKPLSRTFRLPNHGRQDLVGRKRELMDLRAKILPGPQQARFVNIYGIEGIGKTSLVLELANTTDIMEHFATVVWINATSTDAINRQFCEIASTMAQPGATFKDTPAQIDFVLETLAEEAKQTLLVFDDFSRKITKSEFALYLPKNGNYVALFLITGWHSPDVISDAIEWPLPALEPDAAMELLLRTSNKTVAHMDDTVSVRMIVDKLCCCPTSIKFAGQFISASGMPLQNFLQHFRLYSLMVFRKESTREYPSDKMAATWVISLLNFYPSDTSFTQDVQEMLIFCAILHSEVICGYFGRFTAILTSKRSSWMERCCNRGVWSNRLFNQLIFGLKEKALINIQDWNPEHLEFALHHSIRNWLVFLRKKPDDLLRIVLDVFQFVAAIMNDWMKRSTSADDLRHLQMYASSCLDILCGPSGIELDEEYSYELQLHKQEILDFKVQFLTFLRKHPRTASGANMLQADMLSMYEQCLTEYQGINQADNEMILKINEAIADIYMERMEYAMAEQIYKENLRLSGQKMSSNLALCFSKQGKFTEASEAFDDIASEWDRLPTRDLLVEVMRHILHAVEANDCNAAELLYDRLKGIIAINDEQAQIKAECLFQIGDIFWYSRKSFDSINVRLEALAIYERLWGTDHYQWLKAAHDLCRCYFTIESWHECESLYCKVIRGYEKVYGPGNEHASSARHCRSHALYNLGKSEESLAQHVLAFQNMLITPGLQETVVQSIFGCLSKQRLDDEGLSIVEQTWAAAQTKLEEGHDFRLRLLRELVQMYTELERYDEAEESLRILISDQESLMANPFNALAGSDEQEMLPIYGVDALVATNDNTQANPVLAETVAGLLGTQAALVEASVTAVTAQIQEYKLNGDEPATEDDNIKQGQSSGGDSTYQDNFDENKSGDESNTGDSGDDNSDYDDENDLLETYLGDLASLASLMQRRTAFKEAEAIHRKILERKLQLGPCSDRSILQTLLDLQYLCERQERADEANKYQQKYIEASTQWEEDWRANYRKRVWI